MFSVTKTTYYSVAQKYIFKSLSGATYTVDTCSSLCFLRTPSTPLCSFFILDINTCHLGGLFEKTTTALTDKAVTAYYNNSKSITGRGH
jgi:hypothetical protein